MTSDPPSDDATFELLRPALAKIGLAGDNTAEGRRERKKRVLRQHISDTASRLFLDRGFNAVTVRQVAEAADVSEKTVFNYFPTKESLLLDREEYDATLLQEALRDRGDGRSIVDGLLEYIEADIRFFLKQWEDEEAPSESVADVERFFAIMRDTPSVAAAATAMQERLKHIAAQTLAERAGVDPDDPEPQVAAGIVMQLWTNRYRLLQRHVVAGRSHDAMHTAMVTDMRRAARVADTGLASFDLVVQPRSGRDQLREAAEATNEARKQIVAAVRKARNAWKQVIKEAKAHHHADEARQRERKAAQKERHAEMGRRHQEMHAARKARQAQKRKR